MRSLNWPRFLGEIIKLGKSQQIYLEEIAVLMKFLLSVNRNQILALQPVTQPDSAKSRQCMVCLV